MNAKKEFIEHVKGKEVLCAFVQVESDRVICKTQWTLLEDEWNDTLITYLKKSYSKKEYDDFISRLDFEYDPGYGGQELYGIIWYKDGTWSERGEYDGSEWWEHKICPEFPEELRV